MLASTTEPEGPAASATPARSENDYRCHLNFFKLSKILTCFAASSCVDKLLAFRRERGTVTTFQFPVNSLNLIFLRFILKWRRSGSNRQPPPCKGGALPVELRPRRAALAAYVKGWFFTNPELSAALGVRGLEPRTSALSELRSNHLSYTPRI
jgi:hypothetical protein